MKEKLIENFIHYHSRNCIGYLFIININKTD